MNETPSVNKALEYLKMHRTRKEFEEKFKLSNSQSWRFLRRLQKMNLITTWDQWKPGKTNRIYYYKTT